MMSEWKKLKEDLMDFVKSCDDTPTEYQQRVYDLKVGGLIAEGDKLNAQYGMLVNALERLVEEDGDTKAWKVLDAHENELKLEAIREIWNNQPSPEQTTGNVYGYLQAHSEWLDKFKELVGDE